jgi:hypothetical protein
MIGIFEKEAGLAVTKSVGLAELHVSEDKLGQREVRTWVIGI